MKEVFFIAKVNKDMSLQLLEGEYESYSDAMTAIALLEPGTYQVQKFFVVD